MFHRREWPNETPEFGWCHQCETWQLFADAAWLRGPYAGRGEPWPCCVNCGADEPWGLGVWDMTEAWKVGHGDHVPGCFGLLRVKECDRQHAERQDVLYPGDCDCPTVERRFDARVGCRCADCGSWFDYWRLFEPDGDRVVWKRPEGGDCGCVDRQSLETAVSRSLENRSGRVRAGTVRVEWRKDWQRVEARPWEV